LNNMRNIKSVTSVGGMPNCSTVVAWVSARLSCSETVTLHLPVLCDRCWHDSTPHSEGCQKGAKRAACVGILLRLVRQEHVVVRPTGGSAGAAIRLARPRGDSAPRGTGQGGGDRCVHSIVVWPVGRRVKRANKKRGEFPRLADVLHKVLSAVPFHDLDFLVCQLVQLIHQFVYLSIRGVNLAFVQFTVRVWCSSLLPMKLEHLLDQCYHAAVAG